VPSGSEGPDPESDFGKGGTAAPGASLPYDRKALEEDERRRLACLDVILCCSVLARCALAVQHADAKVKGAAKPSGISEESSPRQASRQTAPLHRVVQAMMVTKAVSSVFREARLRSAADGAASHTDTGGALDYASFYRAQECRHPGEEVTAEGALAMLQVAALQSTAEGDADVVAWRPEPRSGSSEDPLEPGLGPIASLGGQLGKLCENPDRARLCAEVDDRWIRNDVAPLCALLFGLGERDRRLAAVHGEHAKDRSMVGVLAFEQLCVMDSS